MKNKTLKIGNEVIEPGETKSINLPVSKLYDFTDISIPIKVVRGTAEGPVLLVCASIHGDEVNGVEIIKRLLKNKSIKTIAGTLIAVPIVNIFGFYQLARYLPDRRDLNRSFPGSANGPLASRLAHLFLNEIVSQCTHGIDLHTGAVHRVNLPQIRACLGDKKTSKLAHSFGVSVVLDAEVIDGSVRKEALKRDIPFLVYEGGEALRYDEASIKTALAGILEVMRTIGMLEERRKVSRKEKSYVAKDSYWIRAPHSGIVRVRKKLGSVISKNDVLGIISDPLGKDAIPVKANKKGIIIGMTRLPLVNRGDALFHVATFNKIDYVSASLTRLEDRFDTI